jgi:hypothetical protein
VLNNGVKGALMEKGLASQVRVLYNFGQTAPPRSYWYSH